MKHLRVFLVIVSLPVANHAFAHEGHGHKEKPSQNKEEKPQEQSLQLEQINALYKENVKPIFQQSCFDCHSQSPNLPWYHSVPFVNDLLEKDMKEAKVHLDFSGDFPFKGHGSEKEDLEAIAKSVQKKTMPPFRYKMMHWGSGLNEEERKTILRWTNDSLKLLDQPKDQKE